MIEFGLVWCKFSDFFIVFGTNLSLFLNILHTIVIQSILGSVIIGLMAEKSKNVYNRIK